MDENATPSTVPAGSQPEIPLTTTPAASAPENNPSNDTTGKPVFIAQTSVGERIDRAVSSVAGKFAGVFKRGRGRPRKDGTPGKLDRLVESPVVGAAGVAPAGGSPAPVGVAGVPPVAGVAPAGAADSLFRRVVVSSVKGVVAVAQKITRILAEAAEIDAKVVDKAVAECAPKPEEIDEFQEALDLVLAKHNVKPKNPEEWALGISALKIGSNFAIGWALLIREAAKNRRARMEAEARQARAVAQSLKEVKP